MSVWLVILLVVGIPVLWYLHRKSRVPDVDGGLMEYHLSQYLTGLHYYN